MIDWGKQIYLSNAVCLIQSVQALNTMKRVIFHWVRCSPWWPWGCNIGFLPTCRLKLVNWLFLSLKPASLCTRTTPLVHLAYQVFRLRLELNIFYFMYIISLKKTPKYLTECNTLKLNTWNRDNNEIIYKRNFWVVPLISSVW